MTRLETADEVNVVGREMTCQWSEGKQMPDMWIAPSTRRMPYRGTADTLVTQCRSSRKAKLKFKKAATRRRTNLNLAAVLEQPNHPDYRFTLLLSSASSSSGRSLNISFACL